MRLVYNYTLVENGTVEIDGQVEPVFKIELLSGGHSNTTLLNVTWKLIAQSHK